AAMLKTASEMAVAFFCGAGAANRSVAVSALLLVSIGSCKTVLIYLTPEFFEISFSAIAALQLAAGGFRNGAGRNKHHLVDANLMFFSYFPDNHPGDFFVGDRNACLIRLGRIFLQPEFPGV